VKATLTRDGATLRVSGTVDYTNADACRQEGLALLGQMPAEVVVDLAGLVSPTSVTVAVLLNWARSAAARQGSLRLAQVPEKCRAILSVSGLAEALPETT
jgi:anti-anti-sigma factor